jgi:hypothetical protein
MMKEMKDKIKEDMNANQAKTNANLKEIREVVKSGQAELRSVVNAWIVDMKKDRERTMSCRVTMVACLDNKELNPEDMESEVEHREVPTEEAAVNSSGAKKKPQKGWHLAAG